MKGVIFTTDSMLAMIVLSIILAGFFLIKSQTQSDNFSNLYLSKTASDILSVLDKNGTLATLDANKINATLSGMLTPNAGGVLTIDSYEWNNGGFNLKQRITVTTASFDQSTLIIARRSFLTFSDRQIQYYNAAYLGIGLR